MFGGGSLSIRTLYETMLKLSTKEGFRIVGTTTDMDDAAGADESTVTTVLFDGIDHESQAAKDVISCGFANSAGGIHDRNVSG